MDKIDKIKKIIVIVLVIILIIVICIIGFYALRKKKEKDQTIDDAGNYPNFSGDIVSEKIQSRDFYTAISCVTSFLDVLDKNNSSYYGRNEKNEYAQIVSDKEIQQIIYNMLSKQYIQKNNISVQDVYSYVDRAENKVLFTPLEVEAKLDTQIQSYAIHGIIQNLQNVYVNDIYIIVNVDTKNHTFSVEPIKEKVIDIKSIEIQNDNKPIEKNSNNIFKYKNINQEYITKEYMNTYKKLALAKPESAYEYLEKEYREKRFGNVQNYIQYVKDNINELKQLTLNQYLVNTYDDYTEYVCKDVYGNLYIFKETGIMEYQLSLDTYTLTTDKFKETYNGSRQDKKVAMNVDTVVQMINNRDYRTIYSLLDPTFKANNFKTEADFSNYMRQKLPLHYKANYTKFNNEGEIYIQTIQLADMTGGTTDLVEMRFIMQLKEGTDFVMSFEI